tara:strand:- start:213 stop:449 length:237 start_codon:yes stop_codon:yes gene_type:complete
MIRQRFFHFFIFFIAKKKLGPFRKKSFLLLIKTFKKKQQSEKRKVFNIHFFQTQEIQVLEKSTSNEKKSYASMAIIWL